MSAEAFIDTNIFIYQLDTSDERKSTIAHRIIRRAVETGDACISFQVIQECMNTILRKADVPLNSDDARRYLDTVLAPLFRISASVALYHRALDIQSRYRYGFYDSLIIAGALEAGCERLYSEDMQANHRIETLTIINPFAL